MAFTSAIREWVITIGADQIPPTPSFYTVPEAATILRCNKNTLYRAIHDGAFPAVRIRTRFVVPAQAVNELAKQAVETGVCVDIAALTAQRRIEREIRRAANS